MAQSGLPPSLDRIEFVRFRNLVVFGGTVAALSLFAVMYHRGGLFKMMPREELEQRISQHRAASATSDTELRSARQAAWEHVSGQITEGLRDKIQWLGAPRHEGHLGWYYMEGAFLIPTERGMVRQYDYSLTLSLKADKSWEAKDVRMTPGEVRPAGPRREPES